MIDTSKPVFPQDYPLEEILALVGDQSGFQLVDPELRKRDLTEDYRIRKGGPAGVFFDMRCDIENALNGSTIHDLPKPGECVSRIKYDEHGNIPVNPEQFMKTLDLIVGNAICKLEGTGIHDSRFVISDYAVPAMAKEGDKIKLVEATRPCTNICQAYWDMVSQEKAGALQDPTY
jgi:hypothetical protein